MYNPHHLPGMAGGIPSAAGGVPGQPPLPGGMMGTGFRPGGFDTTQQTQTTQQQKHDIFVGNLAFSTTEEQLYQAFSEIGKIVKVRMVSDLETGKPRGFAFIEFEDPQAALSAIRNMNDYELNGRRIRVNFSNSSHLETLAGRLGMDLSQHSHSAQKKDAMASSSEGGGGGTDAVADALRSMTKGEMYDVISQLKSVADSDPDEARKLLCAHPQLPEAVLHLMSKLEMIQTPIETQTAMTAPPPQQQPPPKLPMQNQPPPPPQRTDPRALDPRANLADPRTRAAADPRRDPRMQQPLPPPPIPPPPMMRPYVPPPQQQQQQQNQAVANLDPALVQQVMSLTPQQIGQLPPDKQQSILALRQQITSGL